MEYKTSYFGVMQSGCNIIVTELLTVIFLSSEKEIVFMNLSLLVKDRELLGSFKKYVIIFFFILIIASIVFV